MSITNIDHAIALVNGEISAGKFADLVTAEQDRIGVLLNLLVMSMKQAGATRIYRCFACGDIMFRRRPSRTKETYCDSDRCRAVARLGKDKPANFEGVKSDFVRSPYREIRNYEGGYTE